MKTEGRVNVVVVGGGAAGLAAAAAAEEAGLSCQILEAQPRLGGRVRTLPMPGGGVFDAGAQIVNGDMRAVLALARRAGLRLSPVPRSGIDLCVVGDDTLRADDLMSPDEVSDLLDDQVVRWDSVGEVLRALRLKLQWMTTPWESVGEAGRGLRHLVEKPTAPRDSLAAALRALLLSSEEEAVAYSHYSECLGRPPEEINAQMARDLISRYASERDDLEFQVPGGMMQIVDRLTADLRHTPRLASPVQRIGVTDDRVAVETAAGLWEADYAVVAVPPPVAQRIAFDIDGSDRLAAILSSFVAGDTIKTVLVFGTAFWRLDGLSGTVVFGDPAGLAVVDTSLDDGSPPRLTAFVGGAVAREWAALGQEARQAMLLRHLSRAFGDDVLSPQTVAEAVWVDDPWSGGGYNATVRTGGYHDAIARLAAWGGRVRFAGAEVDDLFWGYVEGAIHSGRNAVARIVADGVQAAA